MNIVVYDDSEKIRELLKNLINHLNNKTYENYNLVLSTDNYKDIKKFLNDNQEPALFFIDIVINGEVTGLELAKYIKSQDNRNLIVFITSYPRYIRYRTASKLLALNIILKSKKYFIFEITDTLKATEILFNNTKMYIVNSKSFGYKAIPYEDILYFFKFKRSEKICLYHEKGTFIFNDNINNVYKKLDNDFIMCSRNCIVNKNKIIGIDIKRQEILLSGSVSCEYSRSHKRELEEWILSLK